MILLDSNIIIYAAQPSYSELRNWLRQQSFAVSELSRLEVLGYHRLSDNELQYFSSFFANCRLIEISRGIIDTAISLRRRFRMSLGDAVIAATALEENMELCTNNQKDFKEVENLKLSDISQFIHE